MGRILSCKIKVGYLAKNLDNKLRIIKTVIFTSHCSTSAQESPSTTSVLQISKAIDSTVSSLIKVSSSPVLSRSFSSRSFFSRSFFSRSFLPHQPFQGFSVVGGFVTHSHQLPKQGFLVVVFTTTFILLLLPH